MILTLVLLSVLRCRMNSSLKKSITNDFFKLFRFWPWIILGPNKVYVGLCLISIIRNIRNVPSNDFAFTNFADML